MEAKLDKHGMIYFDGSMKLCPFSYNRRTEYQNQCGMWCVLCDVRYTTKNIVFSLCHKDFAFPKSNFTDER